MKPVLKCVRTPCAVNCATLKYWTLQFNVLWLLYLRGEPKLNLYDRWKIGTLEVKIDIPDSIKQGQPNEMGQTLDILGCAPDRRIQFKTVLVDYLSRTRLQLYHRNGPP